MVTVLLIVAGLTASLAIFNGLYPAINRSSGAITSATTKVSDRIESRVEIIQVSDNASAVDIWVKNVGTSTIGTIQNSDIFYGPEDNFDRVPYANSGPPYPYWDYQLEGNNDEWKPTVTLKITTHLASPPSAGTYLVKVIIPNGIFDDTTFSVD